MSERLPETETRNEDTAGLDRLATRELIAVLTGQQSDAVNAVAGVTDALAEVADAIAQRLQSGGRLHYVGAGTSGRLAILDAAEMPPTFATPPELVCAHIAGGDRALTHAVEGAEDDGEAGERAVAGVRAQDAVIGLSASGGAEYVVRALRAARKRGAYTAALVNSHPSPLGSVVERAVLLHTGAEAIAGSTRLKAGTAQKIALNAISTAVMVRLGKVYDNLMVDVTPTNRKLRARARALVARIARVDDARATQLLELAGGSVKIAVVMHVRKVGAAAARRLLDECGSALRPVIE